MESVLSENDARVQRKIRQVMADVVKQIAQGEEPVLKCDETLVRGGVPLHRRNQLKKFALAVWLLSKIHDMINQGVTTTKRDLYYQKKGVVFDYQRDVDRTVTDCCNILNEERNFLHIISTAKGLVFGDLQYCIKEAEVTDCCKNPNGTVIPSNIQEITDLQSNAKYILLVEKDATFQLLLQEKIHEVKNMSCIMITGKGYPDISTRYFVRKISEYFNLKVLCLTDSGAHGIEIMLTYKYGPKTTSMESCNCECPNTYWLGVKPSEIFRFHIREEEHQILDERELRKIPRLLRRPCISTEPELAKELVLLQQMKTKIEIQNLCNLGPMFLTNVYLLHRIKKILSEEPVKVANEE